MSRKKIVVPLSVTGINQLQDELKEYQRWQNDCAKELARRLAELGKSVASIRFEQSSYKGMMDANVSVVAIPDGYKVVANGESVLFIEFGAGIKYGYGHPEANEFGMGPGTYTSEKGNWEKEKGWYIPKDKGGGHTYGNPPAMPMYEARKAIEQELPRIVKEVFTR